MKNISLTIDEIHEIREEHYRRTKNMTFEEYRKDLDEEIAPILLILNNAKKNAIIQKHP